jgi:SAM-dependent methyltransferase
MDDPIEPSCCTPADARVARRFDARAAQWADADEFSTMVPVSAALLSLLDDAGAIRPSVLELGCGTGALSVALLTAGAASVSGVDLSPASIRVAERRAASAGFQDRASFVAGNAASLELAPHDWVVLDRSLCCFADAPALLDSALSAAGRRIALSVPESRGWRGLLNRVMWRAENLWDRVSGGCPGYVHDLRRMEARLAGAGFTRRRSVRVGLWHAGVYDR